MKKIIKITLLMLALLLVDLLIGCDASKTPLGFVAIGRVDTYQTLANNQPVRLKLISGQELKTIALIDTDTEASYQYVITKPQEIGLTNADVSTGFLYNIEMYFNDPCVFTSVVLNLDGETRKFDIGHCELVNLTSDVLAPSIPADLELTFVSSSFTNNEYITLHVYNPNANPIGIIDWAIVNPENSLNLHVNRAIKAPSFLISGQKTCFAHIYIEEDSQLLYANTLIAIDYRYNGNLYTVYQTLEVGLTATDYLETPIIDCLTLAIGYEEA